MAKKEDNQKKKVKKKFKWSLIFMKWFLLPLILFLISLGLLGFNFFLFSEINEKSKKIESTKKSWKKENVKVIQEREKIEKLKKYPIVELEEYDDILYSKLLSNKELFGINDNIEKEKLYQNFLKTKTIKKIPVKYSMYHTGIYLDTNYNLFKQYEKVLGYFKTAIEDIIINGDTVSFNGYIIFKDEIETEVEENKTEKTNSKKGK